MTSKLILGLDLGVSSIGWALLRENEKNQKTIIDMGVRLVPLSPDDKVEFEQGNAITKNQKRSSKKSMRRGLDRYQLRRAALIKVLKSVGMLPTKDQILRLPVLDLWKIRAEAAEKPIDDLGLIGRVLLHLNQRRGYQSLSKEELNDKKIGDYVKNVVGRHAMIREKGKTIGQYFYEELAIDPNFRVREKVFPREAYKEEFDAIWNCQKVKHSHIFTDVLYKKLRNEIIFYQRALKSKKSLVSLCAFELQRITTKEGKEVFVGPRVAPRSSPLFQVCKIWESINNLQVRHRKNFAEKISPTMEQKQRIFDVLNKKKELKSDDLLKLMDLSKNDGYYFQKNITLKGIQGNLTVSAIAAILGSNHPALQFNLELVDSVDKSTGELMPKSVVSEACEQEPLYRLWHYIYSIKDKQACIKKLKDEFGISHEEADLLSKLDFTKGGYGDKSSKAMRKLISHLKQGFMYSEACDRAGFEHSKSETKEDIEQKVLINQLKLIPKNELRQPVVEKILNQLIQVVNAIIAKHELNNGNPENELFEIRIELARELKQSKEERSNTYKAINAIEKQKLDIRKELEQFKGGARRVISEKDVLKYRLWLEFDKCSPYEPGKTISLTELLTPGMYEVEHIIPRSLHFDDSFSNKTLSTPMHNSGQFGKNQKTAFDYMKGRADADFEAYLNLIERQYKAGKISKTKYENLLRTGKDIPKDFINRQLNETRFITRKACEVLKPCARYTMVTIGAITDHLKKLWGWEDIIAHLNFDKYKAVGQTEVIEVVRNGQVHEIERIKDWSKRDDNRHHAIDALAVACTSRGIVQRINTLSAQETRQTMLDEKKEKHLADRHSLLDNYLLDLKPFDTHTVSQWIANTVVSLKGGKKVATFSTRKAKVGGKLKVVQKHIIAPRGALSEESVYGKIKRKVVGEIKIEAALNRIDDIQNEAIKAELSNRLKACGNDIAKTMAHIKKNPIPNPEKPDAPLTKVTINDFRYEYVLRYPIDKIGPKDLDNIVDSAVAEAIRQRLALHDNDPKKAFKDLEKNPVWLNKSKGICIKSVRCYTGLKEESVNPIQVRDDGWGLDFEKYVKPGNNHHIAIYKDKAGKLVEHVVSFWHAVERKKYGITPVIKSPTEVWSKILSSNLATRLPESFLKALPEDGLSFVIDMQQNELFVFNMPEQDLKSAIENRSWSDIIPNLYRVRKITSGKYFFNHILEPKPRESLADKKAGRCIQASLSSFKGIKVRVDLLGKLELV